MAEQRAERRLAAILAGDIAGYSRLMGADEEGTLSRLNAHRREFLEPKIADHRGRIVKRTGDGILIEFASAVDAARCAVEIQRGMAERNTSVPQDERIEFRIASGVPRLDCTLRRLEEEQREFHDFLARLRMAKDKAEFDQFMAERRTRTGPSSSPHS
jgi:class 3 adenylate cyclase